MHNNPTPTARRIANAKRTLEAAGYIVIVPSPKPPADLRDQCEYPDHRGEPGDTCIRLTRRKRDTPHGWLWLCSEHYDAPLDELFDERVEST